jgi:hypothetical protein
MSQRAEELAAAGAVLAAEGLEELAVAEAAADMARDLAAEGVAEVAAGAAELGAAAEIEEVAETIRKESDK